MAMNPRLLRPTSPTKPNLWKVSQPTILNGGTGSNGAWDGNALTMSNSATGSGASFPRFSFALSDVAAGQSYVVNGKLSGDIAAMSYIRLAASGALTDISYNNSTGDFSGTVTAGAGVLQFLMNGTQGAKSVSIESVSIFLA